MFGVLRWIGVRGAVVNWRRFGGLGEVMSGLICGGLIRGWGFCVGGAATAGEWGRRDGIPDWGDGGAELGESGDWVAIGVLHANQCRSRADAFCASSIRERIVGKPARVTWSRASGSIASFVGEGGGMLLEGWWSWRVFDFKSALPETTCRVSWLFGFDAGGEMRGASSLPCRVLKLLWVCQPCSSARRLENAANDRQSRSV